MNDQHATATRERAKQAFTDGEFELAAELYEILWTTINTQDKWDGWNLARTLRKLKRLGEALEICRAVYQIDRDFEYNNNEYGWCIYQLHIKINDDEIKSDEQEFFHAAEAITTTICKQTQYSPYEKTVLQVLKYLKPHRKQPNVARKILEWTKKLNPDLLSTEVERYEREGETEEGASPREKWFTHRSAALFELGEYEACIEICEQALSSLQRLHYGNQHWFKMRIANAKGHLGQINEAINDLENLARSKPMWFIYNDLAFWYYNQKRFEEAFKYASLGALAHNNHDKLENKWELFLLMGQILRDKGNIECARTHICLAYKLREEQQWSIPRDLGTMMRELIVEEDNEQSSKTLYNELKTEWELVVPRLQGTIKKIRSDKEFGFVLGSDNNEYHFKFRDFKTRRQNLREGLSVTFQTQDSYDRVKDRATIVAINIREIRS